MYKLIYFLFFNYVCDCKLYWHLLSSQFDTIRFCGNVNLPNFHRNLNYGKDQNKKSKLLFALLQFAQDNFSYLNPFIPNRVFSNLVFGTLFSTGLRNF